MLIKVFDSEWFEPTGGRLVYDGEWEDNRGTTLVFGINVYENPEYGHSSSPVSQTISSYNGVYFPGKTPDEVAAEINKQIKEAGKDS